MDEEAVEPQQNEMNEILEQPEVEQDEVQEQPEREVTQVPLSALQKQRQKTRELELELQWERQQRQQQVKQPEPEEDNSSYESATRADLRNAKQEAVRDIEERLWIRANPDKYEEINEFLPKFLKQRPNLASAINSATNRYEEAFTLMNALSPKEQQKIAKSAPIKRDAPNAPTGIPRSAALNQSIDVMEMDDVEFGKWRASKRRR